MDTAGRPLRFATVAVECAPVALLALSACALAWRERGSVAAADWLGHAIAAAFLLGAVLALARPRRLSRSASVSLAALVALAAWAAFSLVWAPLPSLARDEGLLTLFYAIVFAVPLVTLASRAGRIAALAAVVLALGATAVATAVRVRFGADPLDAYAGSGRLFFPIGYVNAQAAFALVGFWPAIALGARRGTPVWLRAVSIGAATAMVGIGALTQSRGGAIAFVVSAVAVFAVLPARLRLAVPALVPIGLVAAAFPRLTEPFQTQFESQEALAASIPPAGEAVLWISAIATACGLIYAVADRRVTLSPPVTALLGRAAGLLVVTVLAIGTVAVVQRVDTPVELLHERWAEFKHEPTTESQAEAATHFLSPGSNRYDFWRVALLEFRDSPITGSGARSFGPAYLVRGDSSETPTRTHSLPLEALAELGIVGFLLLAIGVGVPFVALWRLRGRVPAAAAFGAGVYWLVHAAADWTWTFPACGIPFFLLLGIALADGRVALARRPKLVAAAACLVAVLAFAPPWLSARYTRLALEQGLPAGREELSRARSFDPLSTEPFYVEAGLAPSAAARAAALGRAAEQEPESVRAQYLLGVALLDAGRAADARQPLRRAKALFPREPLIDVALKRAG